MVHVPGTGLFGSGHCGGMAALTCAFQASGTKSNAKNAFPTANGASFGTGPVAAVCYGTIHVPLCTKLVVVPPASVALV